MFFVKSISNLLNEVKEFTIEKKKCFDKIINKIYISDFVKKKFKNTNKAQINNNQEEEKEDLKITRSQIGDVTNILEKKNLINDSNFSKYSESSQNQILKMKDEIKQYKNEKNDLLNKIKEYENIINNKNFITIIFYNELNKKEYPLKIYTKKNKMENLIKNFIDVYPEFKVDEIKTNFLVDGNTVNIDSEPNCNNNTRIGFWPCNN